MYKIFWNNSNRHTKDIYLHITCVGTIGKFRDFFIKLRFLRRRRWN